MLLGYPPMLALPLAAVAVAMLAAEHYPAVAAALSLSPLPAPQTPDAKPLLRLGVVVWQHYDGLAGLRCFFVMLRSNLLRAEHRQTNTR